MRALVFIGKESVRHESVADPRVEEPGDAIVAVRVAGICGSDLHVYHEREQGLDPGTAMGHEFLGEIVEAGDGVARFRRGDTVVCPFTTSCGKCFYCREGLTSRCPSGRLFGWVENGTGLQGAQADYVRVPLADSTLVRLPEGVSQDEALLLGDVLPTGYFCAELAACAPGKTCGVVGCGPVGLMAALSARHMGCERVYAIDLLPERLKLAERFGATALDGRDDDLAARIRDATGGRGLDAVLEVVGSPEALRLAYELVRPGGVIASVGVHTERSFDISPAEAYDKNLTLRTGRCPARHYMERLLPLVREQRYPLGSVISHRLPLAEGARGYELFDRKLDGCTKVLLRP